MKRTPKLFSILLTLALLLGLAPWATVPARAEDETVIDTNTTEWSGNMVVNSDVTISGRVTLTGNTVLTIGEGKTLTVDGISGKEDNTSKNLTINGNGSLTVKGTYSSIRVGDATKDKFGTLTVNGGTVRVEFPAQDIYCAELVCSGGSVELAGQTVYSAVTLAGGTIKAADYRNNGEVDVTVAEGYTYTLNGAGEYTGTMLNGNEYMKGRNSGVKLLAPYVAVAQIGVNEYASVQAAIDAANNNATVKLLADVNLDAPLTVSENKAVILDLNGHTIDRGLAGKDAAGYGNVIEVNGTLTLMDSSEGGTGKITGGNSTGQGGGVFVYGNGTFNMEGGTITGNKADSGGGVSVDGVATFIMTGGAITGNIGDYGGGGVLVGGTFNMEGGSITGNIADYGGGGVYVSGSFTMTGGSITGNNNADNGTGSGVCVSRDGTFSVSGAPVISGNTKGENTPNNVGFSTFANVKVITVTGALTDGASIYVNAGADATFAQAGNSYSIKPTDAACFHSDTDEKIFGALGTDGVKFADAASVSGEVTDGTLTYTVTAPAGAKLIAARYDGGRMTAVTVMTDVEPNALSTGTLTLGGTGDEYRLFLVDGATSAPLCAAWTNCQ